MLHQYQGKSQGSFKLVLLPTPTSSVRTVVESHIEACKIFSWGLTNEALEKTWSGTLSILKLSTFLAQGLLKIWTWHSNWFLLNPKPFEIAQQKLQHSYNLERNEFSPNFKGVPQKMGLPCPLEVLEGFGRKSKSEAPRALKFCTKRVPIKVNNWWKFGVDIFNHLWDIQNWKIFLP